MEYQQAESVKGDRDVPSLYAWLLIGASFLMASYIQQRSISLGIQEMAVISGTDTSAEEGTGSEIDSTGGTPEVSATEGIRTPKQPVVFPFREGEDILQ